MPEETGISEEGGFFGKMEMVKILREANKPLSSSSVKF